MLEKRRSKLVVLLNLIIIQTILAGIGETEFTGRLLSLVLFGVTILLIIRSVLKKNTLLLIVFLFMGSYSFIPITYYFFDQYFSFYTQCYESPLIFFTAQLLLLFYSFLYYFLKIYDLNPQIVIKLKPNLTGYVITLGFVVGIILSRVSGDSILVSGSYSGVTSTRSFVPIEYALMFIPLSYIYSSNKFQRILLYIVTLLFCIKYMLYGGRVALIEVFLVFFILKFQHEWSMKKSLIYVAILGISLLFYGVVRSDLVGAKFTTESIDFNSANAGEVYYSSMRILYFIKHNILTTTDRITAFFLYLSSPFALSLWLPPLANLSSYLKTQYPVGGGGLAPIYIYAFLSYPGVILLGYAIGKIFSYITKFSEINIKSVYVILAVTMVPRWFVYYPSQLIKLCLYEVIAYVLLNSLNTLLRKKYHHNL